MVTTRTGGAAQAAEDVEAEVVAQNSSPRRLPAEELGRLANDVLGPARVTVHADLADALAVAMEQAAALGPSTAVLVTGSVVTAAESRTILSAEPSPPPADAHTSAFPR